MRSKVVGFYAIPDAAWEPPDLLLDELFPSWRDPDEIMWEFSEAWRAKWYQKLWYGLSCWFRTGKWPIRIWVIPWNGGKLNSELYQKIYKEVSKCPSAYVSS